NHLAECGVLVIKEAAIAGYNEELAVGAIGIRRAGHGNNAACVVRGVELSRKLLARTAGAIAARVARLRHETVDDAVEQQTIIEVLANQLLDAGHGLGRPIGMKLD